MVVERSRHKPCLGPLHSRSQAEGDNAMNLQQMQSMSRWKVNALALFFLIDTLVRAVWRRKGRGISGVARYPLSLVWRIAESLVGFFFLTWRVRIALCVYAWLRRIDDVMDEDAKPPKGYTREQYLEQKKQVVGSLSGLGDRRASLLAEDVLLVRLLQEEKRRNLGVASEIINLWSVMCWDDKRRRLRISIQREEMIRFAILQDESILAVCAKLFGGDTVRLREVSVIFAGIMTRTDWLRDIEIDLRRGSVSIPTEALDEHAIELPRLFACKSWDELSALPGFISWYAEEVRALGARWADVLTALGRDFGGVFSFWPLAFSVRKFLVEEFKRAFEESSRRFPQGV